jgi:hypothetical protein
LAGADALEEGVLMSQIPGELGETLRSNFVNNFRSMGFSAEDDALAYLSKARISAKNLNFGLSGVWSAPDGTRALASHAIPPP